MTATPRRTVDLSPLNKSCQRETFAMESPFHLARRIPKNAWKTVTDAWNGYHSVPLRESDRHLTTFITPVRPLAIHEGTARVPVIRGRLQPPLRRYTILGGAVKERCVDDTIHYDTRNWSSTGGEHRPPNPHRTGRRRPQP
ncbi:hypothetical protein QZH41_002471 [Actinostola sp. cb2023]|nr:hypothetical protein QZH41_002471 [Actinostola sp. cb2023]